MDVEVCNTQEYGLVPKNLVDKIIDLLSELANSGNGNNSEVNIANQIG